MTIQVARQGLKDGRRALPEARPSEVGKEAHAARLTKAHQLRMRHPGTIMACNDLLHLIGLDLHSTSGERRIAMKL